MKVRPYIHVRLADGNRQFVDPVYAANGKLKPFYAVIDGTPSITTKACTTLAI